MSQTNLPALPGRTAPAKRPKLRSKRPTHEKAAAVLALLDEKTLNALAGRIPSKHRDKLAAAVQKLRSVPKREQQAIAREFADRFNFERNAVRGSDETVSRLTSTLFEDEDGGEEPQSADLDEMLAQLDQTPFWDKVGNVPLKKLVAFFEERSPTVLSIAMRELSDDMSSTLAGELDDSMVREAILLIATAKSINPLAIEAVEKMINDALLTSGPADADDDDNNEGTEKIAAILNRLTSRRRENFLEALQETLPADDMGEIAGRVLSFEALEYRLPRNAIPVLFREIPEPEILTALKYAIAQKVPVAEYMLKNISQRLAAGYREQMDAMPEVDDEVGEKAQSNVICKLLKIVEEGRVDLIPAEKPTEKELDD